MAKFKQGHRELSINTPLGSDVLLLTKFTGTEALSAPFEYELEMLSEKPDINFSDILGKNVSVSLSAKAGALSAASSIRYFNGYISHFQQTHSEGNIYHYSAVMVPWLWFLKRRRDCRIFQKLTVPQIVQQIFSDLGFSSVVDNALTATYRTWDYCVQYRETDFDFVSRLLENEGIYYFFKHEKDAQSGNVTHKLVVADGVSASVNISGDAGISYLGPDRAAKGDYIRDWKLRQTLKSGNFMLNDYDFTAPKKSLLTSAANTAGVVSQTDHRVYDYPGGYSQSADGGNYVQARMQEQQAGFAVASASSNNRGIEAGYLFTLADHPVSAMNQTYLIQSVQYDIRNENYLQNQPGPVETTFKGNLTCFESSQQFRPARNTPKALVRGPQTAVVVGPSGEKIYTDEYGRVKVQFYWDTYGTSDQNSSCWIRVSQSWAGAPNNGLNWGDMALPHVGDEVIVDFLEGDPDKPLITGRVYNADNMPPESLPANKHKRIFRDDYGNQITMDATPGDEHVKIYSPNLQSTLIVGEGVLSTTNYSNSTFQHAASYASAVLAPTAVFRLGSLVTGAFFGETNFCMLSTTSWVGKDQLRMTGGDDSQFVDGILGFITKKSVIIGADKSICLVGGKKDATSTNTASSILHLSSSGAALEVGPPKSVDDLSLVGHGLRMQKAGAALSVVAFMLSYIGNELSSHESSVDSALNAGVNAGNKTVSINGGTVTSSNNSGASSTQTVDPVAVQSAVNKTTTILEDAAVAVGAVGLVYTLINVVTTKVMKPLVLATSAYASGDVSGGVKIDDQGNIKLESAKGTILLNSPKKKVTIGAGTQGSGTDLIVKPGGITIANDNGSGKLKLAKFDVNSGAFTVAQ